MNKSVSDLPLASEFPAVSEPQWRKLVDAVLKGAPFDKRLVSKTYDGLRIDPLYPRAANASPVAGRTPGAPWTLMQRVDHPDPAKANAQALHDLENGANGLTLVFAGSVSANGYGLDGAADVIARALDSVVLDAGIVLDLNLSPANRSSIRHFPVLVKKLGLAPASVDLRASLNPIGGFAASGSAPVTWEKLSKALAELVSELAAAGFRGPFAVADGRIIHNAGGSEAQELAFALASATDYLRALTDGGIPLEQARSMIYFRLTADADEFLTIAKLRAMRKLWARVEEACGLSPKPTIVATETAWRMLTRRDPDVNILRNTIAVAAAGLGGADTVTVLPHTAPLGLPDEFARRVARNTQLILLEESNLAKVSDPAAGAGGIENLTSQLCASAWKMFQEIEKAGGAWAALEQKHIQQHVATVRAAREKAVALRRDPLTGTTEYPNIHERSSAVLDVATVKLPKEHVSAVTTEPLPRLRLAEPFETLRDASDATLAKTGKRPSVFLANLGKPAEFIARATFAKNFYEAGGIEAPGNEGFATPEELLAAFKASGARLACLCSTDDVYARDAAAAAKALKNAGANLHLAGKPGDGEAALREAGVQTFIFAGCDALATLQATHASLGLKA
jgi:methylmalonyl-CoA mutase